MGFLVKHVKKHGKRIGTVVAFAENGKIMVGCSRCNYKAGDRFDPAHGILNAVDTAFEPGSKFFIKALIPSLRKEVAIMIDRANAYFKDCPKVVNPFTEASVELFIDTADAANKLADKLNMYSDVMTEAVITGVFEWKTPATFGSVFCGLYES